MREAMEAKEKTYATHQDGLMLLAATKKLQRRIHEDTTEDFLTPTEDIKCYQYVKRILKPSGQVHPLQTTIPMGARRRCLHFSTLSRSVEMQQTPISLGVRLLKLPSTWF